MPSVKIGKKLASDCIKESHGLQVCQKSVLIAKKVSCDARVYQVAEDIFSFTQSNKDASGKENSLELKEQWGFTDRDTVPREQVFLGHLSTLTNTIPENLEHTSSICSSDIGTFFSPNLDSVDFFRNEGIDMTYMAPSETEDNRNSALSSFEIQACSISDICASEISFPVPLSRCNLESGNHTDTAFSSDYECDDSSLVCNLEQDYMVLPSLEDVLDPESNSAARLSKGACIEAENSNIYLGNQLRSSIQDVNVNGCLNLDHDFFDPQLYIRTQPDQSDLTCSMLPIFGLDLKLKRVTLVLDLDETLVHSTLDTSSDADFRFTVLLNEKEHVISVKQRPHLQTFLKKVAEMFEVVVFTASQSVYAKQILDALDPDGVIISRRAYRDSCIFYEGGYIKDLTIFGVDMSKVAIIDNSPQVFRLQVNNGIPIKSWFDDPSDSALISLLPFLESLVDADDVRPIIAKKFGNKE